MKRALLIFHRNPMLGKVKTRLARKVGDEAALAIYIKLASHTRELAQKVNSRRYLFYSDYVDTEDAWLSQFFEKKLQQGNDLGERMMNAFTEAFKGGNDSVIVIGTDCLELNSAMVEKAFAMLKMNQVVIGPAKDGGYYLLGLREFHPEFFKDKKWSTGSVLTETLAEVKKLALSLGLLPELSDVDEVEDLPEKLRK